MSMQVREIIDQFEAANNGMISIIGSCNEEQLRTITTAEGWTVAATAHHVAIVYPAFANITELYARGGTYNPTTTQEEIDEMNAAHARDYANVPGDEVLEKLKVGGAQIAAALETIPAENLSNVAGIYAGNELTVEQALAYIVVGHTNQHLASLQETLGGASG